MSSRRADENIQEINWEVGPDDWITPNSPPSVLRQYLEIRAKYERGGHLRPLPPNHWIWEALKQAPLEDKSPEPPPL